jgi:hypothetical protein
MTSDLFEKLGRMFEPREPELELHEQLMCSAGTDFVVTLLAAGHSQALITDDFDFARREAEAHAAALPSAGFRSAVPPDHHALRREGRMAWVLSAPDSTQLALGRLVYHQAVCPEQEPLGLVGVLGDKGRPVLFIAIGVGERGEHHLGLLRSYGPRLRFQDYPVRDLRGAYPRSVSGATQWGSADRHPCLTPASELGVAVSRAA